MNMMSMLLLSDTTKPAKNHILYSIYGFAAGVLAIMWACIAIVNGPWIVQAICIPIAVLAFFFGAYHAAKFASIPDPNEQ